MHPRWRAFAVLLSLVVSATISIDSSAAKQTATAESVAWTSIGPTGICFDTPACSTLATYSGRVSSIAVHPSDPNTIYVGGASGGVWKSTDGGTSWAPLFDDQPSLWIGAVALDPNNPETVYVGTGEAIRAGFPGAGMFKSVDGGQTWIKIGNPTFDHCKFSDLIVSPIDPNLLLTSVALAGPDFSSDPLCASGIYRSTNAGNTWTRIHAPAAMENSASDLAVSAASPTDWYAAIAGGGVFKSTDGGATWSRLGTGFPDNAERIKIGVSSTDPAIVYAAATDGNEELEGMYKFDGSGSWIQIASPGSESSPFCRGQCGYDLVVAVDPGDADTVYAGGVTLHRSTNGGQTFESIQTINGGVIHADMHALAFDSLGRLLIGSDGGPYRLSADDSAYSSLSRGLGITQFNGGLSGTTQTVMMGGTHDNGVIKYVGSLQWRTLIGGDGAGTAVDPTDPNILYYETNRLIYRSTDGVFGLKISTPELESGPVAFEHQPLVLSPSDPQRLYVSRDRLWVTENAGTTWEPASPVFLSCCIHAVAPAPSSPSTIYVGTEGGLVMVTRDDTQTWQNVSPPAGFDTLDIAVHPSDPLDVYAVMRSFSSNHRVWHTTDGGQTWEDISGNLPAITALSIAIDTGASPPNVFVGTHYGVYYSKGDGGWARLGTGLPDVRVEDMIFESSRRLVAATYGRGVWMGQIPLDLDAPPAPTTFQRSLTIRLAKHLLVKGALAVDPGAPTECLENEKVSVFRKSGGRSVRVGQALVNRSGSYSVRVNDRAGRYFARVKSRDISGVTCLVAISPTKRHSH